MSVRRKLRVLVATTASGFVLLIGLNVSISLRETRELERLETELVPRLELAPRLREAYFVLRRGLEQAVSAQDGDALEATRDAQLVFLDRIEKGRGVLSPKEVQELRAAAVHYYTSAATVSARMIAGETGEPIVTAVKEMQRLQLELGTVLDRSTRIDRAELTRAFTALHDARRTGERLAALISIGCLLIVLWLSLRMSREVLRALSEISEGFARFAEGKFGESISVSTQGDLSELAAKANDMAAKLRALGEQRDRVDWLRAGVNGLSYELRGELEPAKVAERALRYLVRYTGVAAGAIYVREEEELRLLASYALAKADAGARSGMRVGDGLVGQAVLDDEVRVVAGLPSGYSAVGSGLGRTTPETVLIVPLSHGGRVTAVLELLMLGACSEENRELCASVRELLAIALWAARSRAALAEALSESQSLTGRLRAREEELFENNRELVSQQEELRLANEELHAQRAELGRQNRELEDAHQTLQQKAEELASVSAFKSQFLANMSHELRTPLNSMLLLSQLLAENSAGNLTEKQVEFCRTIHGAGTDLLKLINQVLDLAKIEAGRRDVELERVEVSDLVTSVRRVFEPLATEKQLAFVVEVREDAPPFIVTDRRAVEQVLVNLLGNAVKFTRQGSVRLTVSRPANAHASQGIIAFAVTDTGVGIAREDRDRVFVPFEQVGKYHDRRFGGTGLGLAISRDIVALLGGQLQLQSTLGEGSTFTLTLPERSLPLEAKTALADARATPFPAGTSVRDDRESLATNEPFLLVVEDDRAFAATVVELAHSQELKVVVAPTGEEGLRLARQHRPRGILLDVRLPDLDGWDVMEKLRRDPLTSGIPVHFLSAVDKPERALALGAVGYLTKPVPRGDLLEAIRQLSASSEERVARVLVVEDDTENGESLVDLLVDEGLEATHVTSARAAIELLDKERIDCMILDLGLPDMDGLGVLDELEKKPLNRTPAVIVYTGRALTRPEARRLESYTRAVVYKDGKSIERLIEEVRLFAKHLREGAPGKSEWTSLAAGGGHELDGKRVLLADDDMRTVYALSALLRSKGMDVLIADTGKNALDVLHQNPDVDAVLMDVMMPEMDGYEAMRRIRLDGRFQSLPVIALTAKAMKSERERCLAEGASDYLSKPVDGDRLFAVLSNWLRPEHAR